MAHHHRSSHGPDRHRTSHSRHTLEPHYYAHPSTHGAPVSYAQDYAPSYRHEAASVAPTVSAAAAATAARHGFPIPPPPPLARPYDYRHESNERTYAPDRYARDSLSPGRTSSASPVNSHKESSPGSAGTRPPRSQTLGELFLLTRPAHFDPVDSEDEDDSRLGSDSEAESDAPRARSRASPSPPPPPDYHHPHHQPYGSAPVHTSGPSRVHKLLHTKRPAPYELGEYGHPDDYPHGVAHPNGGSVGGIGPLVSGGGARRLVDYGDPLSNGARTAKRVAVVQQQREAQQKRAAPPAGRFKCTYPGCAKSFTREGDRQRHMSTTLHKGEEITAERRAEIMAETRDSHRQYCIRCGRILLRVESRRRHEETPGACER